MKLNTQTQSKLSRKNEHKKHKYIKCRKERTQNNSNNKCNQVPLLLRRHDRSWKRWRYRTSSTAPNNNRMKRIIIIPIMFSVYLWLQGGVIRRRVWGIFIKFFGIDVPFLACIQNLFPQYENSKNIHSSASSLNDDEVNGAAAVRTRMLSQLIIIIIKVVWRIIDFETKRWNTMRETWGGAVFSIGNHIQF